MNIMRSLTKSWKIERRANQNWKQDNWEKKNKKKKTKKNSTLDHKKVDQRHERKVVEIIHTKHTQKI